jgi:hypothetical protein
MAAAARPPGVSDARVPCPLCGGLIHPIAGRCKHCKQDLSGHRSARPAAAAPLPALVGTARPATPLPVAPEPSQPILPPQPTGTSVAAERSTWRSWPVVVIVLATLAIVTAVAILVWPAGSRGAGKHGLVPPPAPERMDTDPLPSHGADPQPSQGADPQPPQGADPQPPSQDPWGDQGRADPPPRHAPDPLPPDPPSPDDTDVFGGVGGGPAGAGIGGLGLHSDFMVTALRHACTRLKSCPNTDSSLLGMCDAFDMLPQRAVPSNCRSAKRCLEAIDHLSCSQTGFGSPQSVVTMFQDCTTAMTSC